MAIGPDFTMPITRRGLLTLDVGDAGHQTRRWLRVHRTAMACRFEVTLDEQDAVFVDAAREALNEADRVEALLTVFRESSELSRVNREGAAGAVDVDAELSRLLQRCARLHAATEGAFDITSTPLSRTWGFLLRNGRVPSSPEIESARRAIGMASVRVDGKRREVRFERPGMALNLGAIGKGYALDCMARVLRRRGVERALLSAGTSSVVAVGGGRRGWPIDLRSPQLPGARLARVHLRDGALGTSGAGEQFVVSDGMRYGHVVDPRTGWPVQGVVSATAIAANGADTDALSTAFFVGGPELAARYCDRHTGTLALITSSRTSDVVQTFRSARHGRPEGLHYVRDATQAQVTVGDRCVFGQYPGAVVED
jgi:FAD:protein FMN transferase